MNLYWQSFLDFLFPRTCVVCEIRSLLASEEYICTNCRSKLPLTDYYRYPAENPMFERIRPFIPVEGVFALLLFTPRGKTQKLLHTIKYRNQPELARVLGRWLGRRLQEDGRQYQWDVLLPIPLFSKKLKRRGYNQSSYFAQGLADVLGIPVVEGVLQRRQATATQTRKSRLARWKNVESVFSIEGAEPIQQQRVLLLDDVITTGATICSGAQKLLDAGARSVSMGAIASA